MGLSELIDGLEQRIVLRTGMILVVNSRHVGPGARLGL
jgi:hypothetical protein